MRLPHFLCIQGVIKISNERKSQIFYQGNGTQTQYSFPFDYLRRAFVKVQLISSDTTTNLTQGTDYNVSDRVVTLANPTSLKIKIYRETTTKPLVGWADASVLRAADMTVQSTQLLHLAEETVDQVQDGGLAQDTDDGVWDARFNRIKNLLDPQNPQDAVTLNYITKNQDALLNRLNNTGAAQNASIVATGDAQNTRLTNTGNTQNARLNTTGDTQDKRLNDLGQKYVDLMTTLKDTATTKASEADSSAALAKAWAMSSSSPDGVAGNKSAKTWAEEAKSSASASATSAKNSANSATASATSATKAATSESNAKKSETASATSEKNAKSSETNAKTSETNAANSAKAAAQSEANAKTWDPTQYVTKTAANMLARNKSYAVGDIAYSPNLPSYLYLECVTAGTTGATEPDMSTIKSGGVILDGEAQFTIKTVCAKEYVDALRKSDEVVQVPITNLVGTDFINGVSCQKSGHVVTVKFNVLKVAEYGAAAKETAILKGFPKPAFDIIWIHASPLNSVTLLRGCLISDYFSWHYCGSWAGSTGKECVCTFTYLTND